MRGEVMFRTAEDMKKRVPLTQEQVEVIREQLAKGMQKTHINRKYNVSLQTVTRIEEEMLAEGTLVEKHLEKSMELNAEFAQKWDKVTGDFKKHVIWVKEGGRKLKPLEGGR